MKETAHKLKSLTAFDISGDYLIGQFERLASDDEETAIDAYTNIARYLLSFSPTQTQSSSKATSEKKIPTNNMRLNMTYR